jgi:hypothetical protein
MCRDWRTGEKARYFDKLNRHKLGVAADNAKGEENALVAEAVAANGRVLMTKPPSMDHVSS